MEREPREEGWTPELLNWLMAWLEIILELPKNKEFLENLRSKTKDS